MKRKTRIISVLSVSIFFLLLYTVITVANKDDIHFTDTLSINLSEITKVEISDFDANYRTTSNPEEIRVLIDYLSRVKYDRLLNDQTAYMPMNTRIIYLYDKETSDFIITYGKEAMISQKVYQVKEGEIDQAFLAAYYRSLASE